MVGNACDKRVRNFHQKEDSSPTIPACRQDISGRDFSEFLYLSPALAWKLKHLDERNIHIEDSLGDVWPVKLAYVGKNLAFREGWDSFYRDHGMHERNSLEILYINGNHFVVRIFNPCGFEKLKFNNGRSRKAKRSKRNAERISKDDFLETPMDDSCMIGRNDGYLQEENMTKRSKRNAEKISRDELAKTPMDNSCMIGRDNGRLQEGNRNFLDLEKLDRVKETPANKSVKASDAEMARDAEIADYPEEVLGTKMNPCCSETTEQAEKTGHDNQTAVVIAKQINGNSGGVVANKMDKGLESNEVPSDAAFNEKLGEEVKAVIGLSCGKELPMVKKCAKIPDPSSDDCCISFSAEVKTLSYLELPVGISSVRGRRDKGVGNVFYLRNSMGQLWPVLCSNKYSVKAFTTNWTNFCKQNNVKPGDECRFHRDPIMMPIYTVDVTRRFAAC